MTRIIRADVSLPEQISSEYPEASRCTRAMLRQQPERRPSALSLLNRPRLQAPLYQLPGMESKTDGRYVVHKGSEPQRGYPSPVIVARQRCELRVGSRETRGPLSARPKVHQPVPQRLERGCMLYLLWVKFRVKLFWRLFGR